MIRAAIAVTAILVLSACERAPVPETPAPILHETPPNLLTLLNGATVVDRTGESSLQLSALQAIDGDPSSAWVTPPDDIEQTVTIALGREALLTRAGIHFGPSRGGRNARSLRFETSTNGTDFASVGTLEAKEQVENWLPIEPVPATHLRVTILGAFSPQANHAIVPALLADGETRSIPPLPDLRGRWRINDFEATISTSDRVVHGVTTENPPRVFRGAWDGRVVRFSWARGLEHGVGLIVADPTGRVLNARMWYLKAHAPFALPAWFGERSGEVRPGVSAPQIMDAFFAAEGKMPLHELVFDGAALVPGSEESLRALARLIEANPRGTFRFASHYVSETSEREDVAMATARLQSLRTELSRLGLDPDRAGYDAAARRDLRDLPWTEPELFLNNRIDLELVRTPGKRAGGKQAS